MITIGTIALLANLQSYIRRLLAKARAATKPKRHKRQRTRVGRHTLALLAVHAGACQGHKHCLRGLSAVRAQGQDRRMAHILVRVLQRLGQIIHGRFLPHTAQADDRRGTHHRAVIAARRLAQAGQHQARALQSLAQRLVALKRQDQVRQGPALGLQELGLVVLPPQPPPVVARHRQSSGARRPRCGCPGRRPRLRPRNCRPPRGRRARSRTRAGPGTRRGRRRRRIARTVVVRRRALARRLAGGYTVSTVRCLQQKS